MDVEIRPAHGHWDGFVEVVGVKKPGGKGCWCMAYRDSRVPNEQRSDFMRDLCQTDPGPGVLAYVDDEPAGWCSIAPRGSYRRLLNSRTLPSPTDTGLDDAADVWTAVCFVVRPKYRRQGLMHHLLRGAVEHARAHGATAVEGFPVEVGTGRVDVISGYVGTTRLFEDEGFARIAQTGGHSGHRPRWLMRLIL